MQAFISLVRRNMNMYLRNRTSVIFSFFTMGIILVLNMVFLGDMNEQHLADVMNIDEKKVACIVESWLMAGIVMVNIVMVIMAGIGIMVDDEQDHKLAAFLVTPTRRMTLTLSYIIATCINAFGLSLFTVVLSQVYLYIGYDKLISFSALIKLMVIILVTIFSVVPFFMCIATLVRSSSSFGAITTTVGTLIGFAAGIYIPMGNLSEQIQNVLKLCPVLYGTALTRQVYTEEMVGKVFSGAPSGVMSTYQKFMGITICWGENEIGFGLSLLILLGSGIIFTLISVILLNCKKASDR